jgi:hypothetical protein
MATPPRYRDVILLGAGASIAGGLPTAAGFTSHLLAARDALASLSIAAPALEAVDRDLAWLVETQARLRPAVKSLITSGRSRKVTFLAVLHPDWCQVISIRG